MCGDCQTLPLTKCACSFAVDARASLRERLDDGESLQSIIASYRAQYGPRAIAIPSDQGLDRALWAVPVTAAVLAAVGLVFLGRKWAKRGATADAASAAAAKVNAPADTSAYDNKLEDELKDIDGM